MFYANQRKQVLSKGIVALWSNWAIGVGCIALLIVAAPMITARFVPVLAVVLEFLLLYLDRVNRRSPTPTCYRVPYIAQNVLFWSALILIFVIIYFTTFNATELTGQPVNLDNPLLPVLVTAPVTVIATAYYIVRNRKMSVCISCHRRNGEAAERSVLSMLYGRESRFQMRLLLVLSGLAAIIAWGYYFWRFNNISINTADTFVFIGIPCILFFLTLIYLGARYYSIHMYYCHNEGMESFISRSGTTVRYLILCGDRLLLAAPEPKPGTVPDVNDLKIDTPVKFVMSFRENFPLQEAVTSFKQTIGLSDCDVRELYRSHDYGMYNNIFHFVVYLAEDVTEKASEELHGEWFSIQEVNTMLQAGLLNADLVTELRRIHTIAMAWKTYDNRGFRLYPIQQYKPSFRISEMPKWDVDFNDNKWLDIAELNQDKPFFRIRRLWQKLVNGN